MDVMIAILLQLFFIIVVSLLMYNLGYKMGYKEGSITTLIELKKFIIKNERKEKSEEGI